MLSLKPRYIAIQKICTSLLLILLSWGLVSCGDRIETSPLQGTESTTRIVQVGKLAEVAPPSIIQTLRESLDQYQPQVSILSPKVDEVFEDTTVSVKLMVQDLPIFKDPDLNLGTHLQVIVDNQPSQAVYDLDQPLILEDLTPGTHTLRVFAVRPWDEGFKNDGAYAQTTFHVLTKTASNKPNPNQPLLTYSSPQGTYGAEPILLDFYLTNAPLHFIAQENSEDEINDWRIRVTVNGQSFLLDNWQPIYLKGLETGKNWVQLEFLDEKGNRVDNVFNNTVRLITYDPKGKDSLSKLVRGELSEAIARRIVDPNYEAKPIPPASPTATPVPSPTVETSPIPEPIVPVEEVTSPVETITPTVEATPTPKLENPVEEAIQEPIQVIEPIIEPIQEPLNVVEPIQEPSQVIEPLVEPITAQPSPSISIPKPSPTVTPSVETIIPEEVIPTEEITSASETEANVVAEELPQAQADNPSPITVSPQKPFPLEKPKWMDNVFSRFQRQSPSPSPAILTEEANPTAVEPEATLQSSQESPEVVMPSPSSSLPSDIEVTPLQ